MQLSIKTIDDYIALHPGKVATDLEKIRRTIQKAVPQAEEVISYGMPAFRFHGMIIYFAAFKEHYSFFVPGYSQLFAKEFKGYDTVKAGFKVPIGKAIPLGLIARMVKYAAKQNLLKAELKKKKKKPAKKSKR